MKRALKLSSGIAALIMAAGTFLSPAAAASTASDLSTASTPVRLWDSGSIIWSRNYYGIFYNVNLYTDQLTAGNWSGYAQDNTGRKIYFCDGQKLFMNNYVVTMFISRTRASWC
ncbi:hypothetical protein [Nonomuraea pusilla]|uniref:Cell wall binding repeat-containing protein n=1 Tax=Nonomuraea pusilla TaxID=46177 RepID=A0A1H7GSI4_9ACTN|nr:hypothetical protein [Nonomuraea pusilla]SEK41058.1 hypothetical protein SAMN05660976_00481 [Nonomuraea pusilla]